MAHGEASGGPVLPPQRRSLQQRFGPHARARDGRGTVRRLLALYARWGRELLLVVCLTLLSTGAALAVPYLLGRAVDCFLPWGGVERAALSVLLPTLAGAAAAQWLGNWGRRRWMEILSQRMVARIRRECFAKLGRLPLSYFDRHPHGDTMNRLVSDADNVSTVAAETVTQLLSSLLMVAGALAIMAALSPLLTLTALATVPVIALCTRLISRRSRTLYRRQADELGRLSGLVQESLSNSRTVKLYHQQEELLARFDQMNGALCATSVKAQICAGLLSPLVNMVNNLGFALIACAGGVLALRGAVSVGLVVSFLGYSRQLGRPLNSIAALFSSIQQAVAGAERLFEILDEPELPPDVPGAVSPRTVRGEVSFADVSFSYEPDRPVLEHVSFRVRAGEVAAFVGETGAGKTTLVNLLMRFYELDGGSISIDGQDITALPRGELRRRIGMVLQDAWLFEGTIAENIAYGRRDATREEIVAAARAACCDHFIRTLPQGYDTPLSGETTGVSQGQMQLLTIARAMLKDAPIVVLDEATAYIDPENEAVVQQAVGKLVAGKTVLVIAHRLSTITGADQIVVVNGGRSQDVGTHGELLKNCPLYQEMWRAHMGAKEGEQA